MFVLMSRNSTEPVQSGHSFRQRNPDGAPNPVISTVLKGNTFNGRAYVVNDWYLTAYEPILDEQKEVVGVLYVGVQQEAVKELRQGIMDLVVGKTGYVYILGGSGQQRGDYVISKDGKRDGENIWEAKDAAGHPFIQSIINKALITKDGECEFEYYDWQNKGEAKPRGQDSRGYLLRSLGLGNRGKYLRIRLSRWPDYR